MLPLVSFLVPAIILVILLGNMYMHKLRSNNHRRSLIKVLDKTLTGKHHRDFIGNRVIALDVNRKALLVADHNAGCPRVITIPLREMTSTILVHHKNIRGQVDRIWLDLVDRSGKLLYRLDFFDHEVDSHLNLPSAARRAFYWKSRIDNHRHISTYAHNAYV